MRKLTRLLALLLCFFAFAEACGEGYAEGGITMARPSTTGALHVEGAKLLGQNGEAVQLKGISTHGIAWFPQYVNAECFQDFASWGANLVRLAMYTGEYDGYCAGGDQEKLKALIRQGVAAAKQNDLYVIVDWHILSDNDPTTHKEEAKQFFAEMTAEFGDDPSILYEICNEPNGGTSWGTIKAYAEEVIPVIRENAPNAVILCGTPNWCQFIWEAAADPITDFDNLMYTMHFYAGTHKDDLRNAMREAVEGGLPVFVSEYGLCDASGNGALDLESTKAWMDEIDALGISCAMWNLSNKDESSAVLQPSCTRTSGFSDGDLSGSGLWLRDMLKNWSGT